MSYVIPPAPQASLTVANSSDRFPVRRIFCVGRNYEEHVVGWEMTPVRHRSFSQNLQMP